MPEINFFWDPLSDNSLQERDDNGAVTAEYTAEPGLYGNIISQNRGGVESQFHYDAQGSTLAVTDDDQSVTDTFAYTAFGEVTERTGTIEVPFQYIGRQGYYTDSVTGQIMARRRPYEPLRARWLAPIREAEGRMYSMSRTTARVGKPDFSDCLAKCNTRDCVACCGKFVPSGDVGTWAECLWQCDHNLPPTWACGKCVIELWCWPAFGVSSEVVHCEFWVRRTDFRHGQCHTGWDKCYMPLWRELFCPCPLGCTGGEWKAGVPERPNKAGAFLAGTKAFVSDAECHCVYNKCLHFPSHKCYNPIPVSDYDSNSNSATGCINEKCDLRFLKPENALGWDHPGGCPKHGWETSAPYD
jgi:YD repeat-containing protein